MFIFLAVLRITPSNDFLHHRPLLVFLDLMKFELYFFTKYESNYLVKSGAELLLFFSMI